MGGSIAVIKKHDDKIYTRSGWTNSLGGATEQLEFYKDPNNDGLSSYMSGSENLDGLIPEGYGIFIVDYDGKNIYTINGYSKYIDILPSAVTMNERHGNPALGKFGSPYHKFFDEGFVAVRSLKCTTLKDDATDFDFKNHQGEKLKHEISYMNATKMGFKDLYEAMEWIEGDSMSMNPFKKKKGNAYIKNEKENYVIFNELQIDLEKMGWSSYDFEESTNGYVQLYKQLMKDGFKLTPYEMQEWNDFCDYDYEEEEDIPSRSFLQIIRSEKLTELGI